MTGSIGRRRRGLAPSREVSARRGRREGRGTGLPARAVGPVACGLALMLGIGAAAAQGESGSGGGTSMSNPSDRGGDAAATPNPGSPLPGGGTTKDLTMPGQGGVADTGLGGSTNGTGNGAVSGEPSRDTGAAGVSGTGSSVKGAAGQGIDGQGTSSGVAAGSSGGGAVGSASGAGGGGASGR